MIDKIDKHIKDFTIRDYLGQKDITCFSNDQLDCSLGINPLIDDELINRYSNNKICISNYPSFDYYDLKIAIINLLKSSVQLKIDNIAFGQGTMGILRTICEILISKNKMVLGYSPQFSRFISEIELKKGIYECYELDRKNNYKFVVEEFVEYIDDKYTAIYIDNPNNPTGQIIDISDIEIIVDAAKKKKIFVIIDEAYGDYMPHDNSAMILINKYNNLIVTKSASKGYGLPGSRIGYIVADKEIISIYNKVSLPFPFSDSSMNLFINILNNNDCFEKTFSEINYKKQMIINSLSKRNYIHTSLYTPIFTLFSAKYENLSEELKKYNIISECCDCFIGLNKQYARIRIPKEHDKLIEIIKQLDL